MADWGYEPHFTFKIDREGPKTLINKAEDGKRVTIEKYTAVKRTFHQRYREETATAKTMLDVLYTINFDTAQTIITFDPRATTPDTDEATVKQLPPLPTTKEVAGAPGLIEFDVRFREV